MSIGHGPLLKPLVDSEFSKSKIRIKASITIRSLAKLGRNENGCTDILQKILTAFNCLLFGIVASKAVIKRRKQIPERRKNIPVCLLKLSQMV